MNENVFVFSAAETPLVIKLRDVIDVYVIEKLSSVACLKFLINIHFDATVTMSVIHFRVITSVN